MTVTGGAGRHMSSPVAQRSTSAVGGADRPVLVVGVDGSAAGVAALQWALGQARHTDARVVAIAASEPPPVMTGGPEVGAGVIASEGVNDEEMAAAAEQWLTEAITRSPADSGNVVERRVVHGDAATVLVEAAAEAELLVLGNHGRGALAGAIAGSVALRCAHHARCPLVLVPSPQ